MGINVLDGVLYSFVLYDRLTHLSGFFCALKIIQFD